MNGVVFLVDDDAAVLRGLTEILEEEGLKVLAFESAESFLAVCDAQSAGCIVLDIRLPDMDGLQVQAKLHHQNILLPVIFLTGHGDVPLSVRAMKAGAYDFLQKPVAADSLLAQVHGALKLNQAQRQESEKNDALRERFARLTSREKGVLDVLLQGKTNKQVAKQLGLSPRTVEIHRRNILSKTEATNLIELSQLHHLADKVQ